MLLCLTIFSSTMLTSLFWNDSGGCERCFNFGIPALNLSQQQNHFFNNTSYENKGNDCTKKNYVNCCHGKFLKKKNEEEMLVNTGAERARNSEAPFLIGLSIQVSKPLVRGVLPFLSPLPFPRKRS